MRKLILPLTLVATFLLLPELSFCPPPPGGGVDPDPGAPIDLGISTLVIAGAVIGGYKKFKK